MWLQEKWSENTVKAYTYGIEKISKDLKEISGLRNKTLFDIKKPATLKELYDKWISVPEFKNKDLVAKYQNSNSFKRFIDFREYEQGLNVNPTNTKLKNQTANELKNTDILTEITDKELLQTIKPLLKKNQVLQAVELSIKHYQGQYQYKNMIFKDWYKLVNQLYQEISES